MTEKTSLSPRASAGAETHHERGFRPEALEVNAFARERAQLNATVPLLQWSRLSEEHSSGQVDMDTLEAAHAVRWQARGEYREHMGARSGAWLFVQGSCHLEKTCQRCMKPVTLDLAFDHAYRFVPTEEEAETLDMESEEDVLAYDSAFNLLELIEDELLLAIPAIPRHDDCGGSVQYQWMDADFEQAQQDAQEQSNPFAVLEQLKKQRNT